ncbi:MAG TPA: M15 family metallopeptidase [Acidimicrobiales bacterium]|nr:M15 family metallopeptidase [Acidimicrobiales bacterium]
MAVLVMATGGLCLGLGRLGGQAVAAARGRTAADAAALAGAAEGEETARAVAEANGGALVDFTEEGAEVQVRVRVGGSDAVARAERVGAAASAGGAVGAAGLTPEMQAALARAEAALGGPVPITSGWRSPAAQRALYANRARNPFPVARPGTSAHERGEAVDVPRSFAPRLAAAGPAVGLCQPLPRTDPVHFELCRRGRA